MANEATTELGKPSAQPTGRMTPPEGLPLPRFLRPRDRGQVLLIGAAPDETNPKAVFLRRVTPAVFIEAEWDPVRDTANLLWAAHGAPGLATSWRQGFHYIARATRDGTLHVTRLRGGWTMEEPVSTGVARLPAGCSLADMTVTASGVVWLLLLRVGELLQGGNEWLVLNAMTGVSMPVAMGTGAPHAAPTLDAGPRDDTLLVCVPAGESPERHGVFSVSPDKRTVTALETPGVCYAPAFSPCGRWVAYAAPSADRTASKTDGPARGPSSVLVANADFSDPVVVARDEWVFDLSWTMDGGHVVVLDGGMPRARKARGGVLRAIPVASGLGPFDLYRPGDGSDGACLFFRCDAGGLRLGPQGQFASRRALGSVATLVRQQFVEALSAPESVESAIRHIEVLVRVDKTLDREIAAALLAWAGGETPVASTVAFPGHVPRLARLLVLACADPEALESRPEGADFGRAFARKAFELLQWQREVAAGLRVGIQDDEMEAWLYVVRLAAGMLSTLASKWAEAAGMGRETRSLMCLAASLILEALRRPDHLRAVGLSAEQVVRALIGPPPPGLDEPVEDWIERVLEGPAAVSPYRDLSAMPSIRPRLPAGLPPEAWARLKGPYSTLSDIGREAPDPGMAPGPPADQIRLALLVDQTLENATWRPAAARSVRSCPMALSAWLWWSLGSPRRFALALARWGREWDGPTPFDADVVRFTDECGGLLPGAEVPLCAALEPCFRGESLDDTLLFHVFRAAYRSMALPGSIDPPDPDAGRRAALLAVACQRLLAARGTDPEGLATTLIEAIEAEGLVCVTETRPNGSGEPEDASLETLWRELQYELSVTAGNVAAYTDSLAAAFLEGFDDVRRRGDAGDGAACLELAGFHETGGGLPADESRVVRLVRKACRLGHPAAFHRLGMLHLEGRGVDRSVIEAAAAFREGARLGDEDCVRELARLEALARPVEKPAPVEPPVPPPAPAVVEPPPAPVLDRARKPTPLSRPRVPDKVELHGLPPDDWPDLDRRGRGPGGWMKIAASLVVAGGVVALAWLGLASLMSEHDETSSPAGYDALVVVIGEPSGSGEEIPLPAEDAPAGADTGSNDEMPTAEDGIPGAEEENPQPVEDVVVRPASKGDTGAPTRLFSYAPSRRERARVAWKRCRTALAGFRVEEARAACENAVVLDKHLLDARVDLGWVLLENGETDKALVLGREVAELSGKDGERRRALLLQAAALTVMHKNKEAVEALESALALAGDEDDCEDRLAVLHDGAMPEKLVLAIAPGWACYHRKGDGEAAKFLARRGVVDQSSFRRRLDALAAGVRTGLEEKGRANCPW